MVDQKFDHRVRCHQVVTLRIGYPHHLVSAESWDWQSIIEEDDVEVLWAGPVVKQRECGFDLICHRLYSDDHTQWCSGCNRCAEHCEGGEDCNIWAWLRLRQHEEATFLILRFGLDSGAVGPRTLKEVGALLSLDDETMRLMDAEVINKAAQSAEVLMWLASASYKQQMKAQGKGN